MGARIVRLLIAVAAIVLVTVPLVGARASAAGFEFAWAPSLKLGGACLAAGLSWLVLHELWTRFASAPAAAASAGISGSAALKVGALVALVAFVAALPLFASGKWIGLVLETLVYTTIATGLNIALGMSGLLVLGHAAFWAVGAYTFSMLTVHFQTNFWIAFPAAGAAAAVVGLILGLPALRLRGDYLAIVTLGFGESIRWIIKNTGHVTGGDAGIPGSELPAASLREPYGVLGRFLWQPTERTGCYYFALALAAACLTSVALLKRSRLGRAMFALREDETAAKCMGVNTVHVKLVAFMSAAMWAGLAGVIHPIYRGQVTPELFNFDASVTFVAMVVLGGLGSVAGSALGAAVLWILPALLRDWIPEVQDYRMLVFGAVLAAMMVVRPEGIVAARAGLRRDVKPGTRRRSDSVTVLLEARSVTKRFGGLAAVSDVSCVVEEGAITAIIGPNGAGKTTFFNCITAVAPPTSGEILFRGERIDGLKPHQVTRLGMARTFQNIRLFRQMSALENVVTARHCRTHSGIVESLLRLPSMREEERQSVLIAEELLDFVGLPQWRDANAASLPYGDQRRLEIARALATEPELLLLDEPAAGMNPRESHTLVELIRRISERGVTVVLIEHHMKVVMGISTHVIVLDHGVKIADCTPEACCKNPIVIEAYLGKEDVT